MNRTTITIRVLAAVAILFGIATIVSGTRVLAGSDPGYPVFRPLLVFNTAMGLAYVAAGVVALRSSRLGLYAAGAICALNGLVLAAIGYLQATGGAIAAESMRAMIFRTGVWLVLLAGFAWVRRGERSTAGR